MSEYQWTPRYARQQAFMSGRNLHWTDHAIPEPNSGCWLWNGRYARNGYGTFGGGRSGERISAHRLAWEDSNGPIPDGMQVLHRCDVRGCVNPGHLFLGTAKDNTADMIAKGRAHFIGGLVNARKTHCKYGHPYSEENTYFYNGSRICRTCCMLRERRKRALKRAMS